MVIYCAAFPHPDLGHPWKFIVHLFHIPICDTHDNLFRHSILFWSSICLGPSISFRSLYRSSDLSATLPCLLWVWSQTPAPAACAPPYCAVCSRRRHRRRPPQRRIRCCMRRAAGAGPLGSTCPLTCAISRRGSSGTPLSAARARTGRRSRAARLAGIPSGHSSPAEWCSVVCAIAPPCECILSSAGEGWFAAHCNCDSGWLSARSTG